MNLENKNIAISYNHLDHGKILIEKNYIDFNEFILENIEKVKIIFKKFSNFNEITYLLKNESIEFIDRYISENKFVRIIKNKKFYYENNKLILFIKELKLKFIAKLNTSKSITDNFLTLDIETYKEDDGTLIIFCICIFDGLKNNYFYISDFKNSEQLIIAALKSIMQRKYHNWNVYIHNMAKLDMIFLLNFLIKLGDIQPIFHKGRWIAVNFNFGKDNQYKLRFKDSYLMLISSLMNLCKSFKNENSKIIYPIFFPNKNNLD